MSNKLRILWHSVAPYVRSGYGKVTKNFTTRLAVHGYKIVVSAYYGLEPGGILNYDNVLVVASKAGPFGIHSAAKFARQFKTDIQILHTDWWAFSDFPKLMPFPVLYSPMDHTNYPEEILNFTRMYKAILSLGRFQQKELKERGLNSYYLPHGVDINTFKPLNKEECKERFGIEDKFVFGTVAANSDKEDRKFHAGMMKAMRYFLDQNPDVKDIVWLYHSNPRDPRGMPLSAIAHKWGLDNIIKFMDPSISDILLREEDLAMLYNAMDVHLLCSKREGFGLPILESMACGVPNICHNFSSMPELVKGRGWLVRSLGTGLNLITTPINAETAMPDVYDLADKIKDAYFNEKKRKRYSKKCRIFARQFNWDDIVLNNFIPILEKIAENFEEKSLKERRIL